MYLHVVLKARRVGVQRGLHNLAAVFDAFPTPNSGAFRSFLWIKHSHVSRHFPVSNFVSF